ncbi:MAG: histidine kinase [Dethiosulfovibrio peptidovorans]|nr:MAG: histidine kinase [Dethiosulfovibrio peptidovorans]
MRRPRLPVRWSLSTVFSLALLLPTVAVFLTAGIGIVHHEQAMDRVMASYVENLAENVASRVHHQDSEWLFPSPLIKMLRQLQVFEWGPSLPGWVAVVDGDGQILLASPGAEATFLRLWREDIPIGRAVDLADDQGQRYTVAVWPAASVFVVAAVAWDQLIGPMVRATRLWGLLMLAVVGTAVVSGAILWRWAIGPIKSLSDELSDLRWGCDIPDARQKRAIWEVRNLRTVLCRLSRAAREKVELWNRYLQDIVRVQEGEKSRFARDLHDGPVQEITALIQRIRLASLESGEKSKEHLCVAEDIGRETVTQLREMCNQLSPPWLDLGLKHSLDELSDRLSRYLGIAIQVEVADGLDEVPDRTLAFFRIVQEAIHNAVRHGEAEHVEVNVDVTESGAQLTVRDDGKGFNFFGDLESLRASGHRGLLNMQERIELVGGSMEIKTALGQGCTLVFKE